MNASGPDPAVNRAPSAWYTEAHPWTAAAGLSCNRPPEALRLLSWAGLSCNMISNYLNGSISTLTHGDHCMNQCMMHAKQTSRPSAQETTLAAAGGPVAALHESLWETPHDAPLRH